MTDEKLYENVQSSFERNLAADKKAASLLEKINAGKGNYVVAGDYAECVGESLRKAYQTNLSGIDGAMHWSTAKAVIEPTLEEEYGIVSTAAATVQQSLNTKAGMGLKAVKASYNSEAVSGIMNKVCSYESYDAAAWVLRDAAVSFARSVVDRTLKANIDFQGKAGRAARVIRRAGFKCCDWCADLEGIYEYPNTPEDIYRRHDNCRCDVEYDPGNGKVQNVHTKEWRDADERDRIEERKNYNRQVSMADKETLRTLNLDSGVVMTSDNSAVTLADINKMSTPYERSVLDSVPSKAGYFDVAAHGNANIIEYGSKNNRITARQLANIIRHDESYNGEKIRLLSCDTGSTSHGFAQQLADALGVEVDAPNDVIIAYPNGTIEIGYDNKGEMITFKPGGGKKT